MACAQSGSWKYRWGPRVAPCCHNLVGRRSWYQLYGGSQAAQGGGGEPQAALSIPLEAREEENTPEEPTAEVSDARGHANEKNRVLGAMGQFPA